MRDDIKEYYQLTDKELAREYNLCKYNATLGLSEPLQSINNHKLLMVKDEIRKRGLR